MQLTVGLAASDQGHAPGSEAHHRGAVHARGAGDRRDRRHVQDVGSDQGGHGRGRHHQPLRQAVHSGRKLVAVRKVPQVAGGSVATTLAAHADAHCGDKMQGRGVGEVM